MELKKDPKDFSKKSWEIRKYYLKKMQKKKFIAVGQTEDTNVI